MVCEQLLGAVAYRIFSSFLAPCSHYPAIFHALYGPAAFAVVVRNLALCVDWDGWLVGCVVGLVCKQEKSEGEGINRFHAASC
jgi:hypothetical protein